MNHAEYDLKLRQCIGYVSTMVGIKELPDKITYGHIKRIFDNYHTITPEEFNLAFELNLIGEFGEVIQHFSVFDSVYVSRVLGFYLHRRNKANKEKEIQENSKALPVHKSTPEDYYNGLVNFYNEKKKMPIAWDFLAVYKYMFHKGMVTESEAWRNDFKKKVIEKVTAEALAKKFKTKNTIERMRIDDSLAGSIDTQVKKEYVIYKIKNCVRWRSEQ